MNMHRPGGGATTDPATVANTSDVANSTARLALAYGTGDGEVQVGDLVRQTDTGVVYMLVGSTPSNAAHWQQLSALPASILASGQVALARGGTGSDLSATGGAGQVLKQSTAGGAITVGALTAAEMGAIYSGLGTNVIPKKNSSGELVNSVFSDDGSLALVYAPLYFGTTVSSSGQINNGGSPGSLFLAKRGGSAGIYFADIIGSSMQGYWSDSGLTVGGLTASAKKLEARDSSALQFRATYTSGTDYVDFGSDEDGNFVVEQSGININIGGTLSTAVGATNIGDGASSYGNSTTVGKNAESTNYYGTTVGNDASSGEGGTTIGDGATNVGYGLSAGKGATTTNVWAMAIGPNTSAGYGQCHIGDNQGIITSYYLGKGASVAAPVDVTLYGTSASTGNTNGGWINLQGGAGSGTGLAGGISITGKFALLSPTVPGSTSATGTAGQIAWDSSYLYVCTATDTWKRAALSTW